MTPERRAEIVARHEVYRRGGFSPKGLDVITLTQDVADLLAENERLTQRWERCDSLIRRALRIVYHEGVEPISDFKADAEAALEQEGGSQ